MMPPIAVLAGGLATRLRPRTEQVPKAMLDVAGEPFIAHQLRLFAREKITRVVLCVGYLAEQIEDFVGDGGRFGVEIVYVPDGPHLRGTGGAIVNALPALGEEFIVTYGDSWLDAPYAPIVQTFRAARQPALMTVFANEGRWDTSNVWFEEGRIRLYDKRARRAEMRHIDWGLSVLRADALAPWRDRDAFDLAEMLADLSRKGELAGFEVAERFYEIGSHEGLAETSALLKAQKPTA